LLELVLGMAIEDNVELLIDAVEGIASVSSSVTLSEAIIA
jgi:hypothetical protein